MLTHRLPSTDVIGQFIERVTTRNKILLEVQKSPWIQFLVQNLVWFTRSTEPITFKLASVWRTHWRTHSTGLKHLFSNVSRSPGVEETRRGGPAGPDVPARGRRPARGRGGFQHNRRQDEPGAVCWCSQQSAPPRPQSWLQELLLEGFHFLLKPHQVLTCLLKPRLLNVTLTCPCFFFFLFQLWPCLFWTNRPIPD